MAHVGLYQHVLQIQKFSVLVSQNSLLVAIYVQYTVHVLHPFEAIFKTALSSDMTLIFGPLA